MSERERTQDNGVAWRSAIHIVIGEEFQEAYVKEEHEFKAEEVCSHGEFNKGSWSGPNRRHLAVKFDRWAEHLFNGVDISDNNSADSNNDGNTGKKAKENIGK